MGDSGEPTQSLVVVTLPREMAAEKSKSKDPDGSSAGATTSPADRLTEDLSAPATTTTTHVLEAECVGAQAKAPAKISRLVRQTIADTLPMTTVPQHLQADAEMRRAGLEEDSNDDFEGDEVMPLTPTIGQKTRIAFARAVPDGKGGTRTKQTAARSTGGHCDNRSPHER